MTQVAFTNGHVLTLDGSWTTAEALLVESGRLVAVGRDAEILGRDGVGAVIDLAGDTVVPGFIDAHNHFARAAFEPHQVDCATPPLTTIDEVLDRISAYASSSRPGEWIRGSGFHWSRIKERRSPSRKELDAVCPANPFVLMDASYHGCFANSLALGLAGIDRHSTAGRAGIIVLDQDGEPTGELLESAMNVPEALSWQAGADQGTTALDHIAEHAERHLAFGITSTSDALVTPSSASLLAAAALEGRLPIHIQMMFGGRRFFDPPDPWLGADGMRSAGSRLSGATMKLFMDAVHPSPAIDRPVGERADAHTGVNYYGRGEAVELVLAAARAGLAVAIHALGNCAVDQALDACEAARIAEPDAHLRIEHFILASEDQARRAADLGVVVVTNPGFLEVWGDQYLERWRFDGREDLRVIRVRSLLDAGATVAFASDHPCAPLDPFHGIWSAVARRSWTGDELYRDESVPPLVALAMYTREAAIAVGRADTEGTLEVGKVANFVVLDRDPTRCSEEELRHTTVLATYVEGQPAYEAARPDGSASAERRVSSAEIVRSGVSGH